MTPHTPAGTKLAVMEAIEQLNGSERGQDVLENFDSFLRAGNGRALSLDVNNWGALVTLVKSCQVWGGYEVLRVIEESKP